MEWKIVRRLVLERDRRRCRRCGNRWRLSPHHVKPRDQGGSNDPRNLITLCDACHDWAEIETAERGLSWVDLLRRPEIDGVRRLWFRDGDGRITAYLLEEEAA